MVNILYINNTGSLVGGCENRLIDRIKHIDRSLYNPIVVCPDAGEFTAKLAELNIPAPVCYFPAEWRKVKSYPLRRLSAMRLVKLAKRHHTDLIHTTNLWLNYYAWRMGQSLKVPIVAHVRDRLKPERIRKYLFDKFDKIITVSEQTRKPLILSGIPAEKIAVIHKGVDTSEFNPSLTKKNVLRRDYPLRELLIGLIGRIEPFKRQREFVHIIAEVLKVQQDVSFLIIGDAPPNRADYFREVQQTIEEYGITEHILFTGYRRDMPEVLASLDLLVSLSAGSVVIEAMASGLPVIGTDIASASEMIVDGVTGRLLPPGDIHVVSKAILRLLEDDKMRDDMGKAARRRAEEVFDVRKNTRLLESVYAELLG